MDGVQLPQGYRAIMRRQFTFHHYVPGIPPNDERLIVLKAFIIDNKQSKQCYITCFSL